MSAQNTPDNDLAGKIQQLLLPKAPPLCSWCCIGVKNRMAVGVGGDYFDFLPTHDGCQMVMIGDVTGHDVAASVVMALLYGYIHRSIEEVCSPLDTVKRVNNFLKNFGERCQIYDHLFSSTLFFGVIVPDSMEMHYVNAAHPAPLVRRADALFELEPSAPLIGFFDVPEDAVRTFRFEKHDRLFLYTDGITETANDQGEHFGAQRLKTLLEQHQGDHQEFLDELFDALMQFNDATAPRDDCTAIVMDFHRPILA
ncbi:PP2C family protein-serine/threonine phosphatase [Geoalkalibacter halelectricus]|uniref:Serine/threonine-protein phosphatase n=1 Tax=Geoalkalibacter halelectricus TaxID=2847045 RepID=A0ABY5ZL89_9BACT|nr:PP2C family protein-serine/threonine phosphatase [Geoalkalibacter halelectricus]MDO3376864.1 serine/threonine-protein phosphatase [Geoalkalibacter halelectricus]UWZ79614.1 serine/threonine-protein phosphatase [Geoalkalibacter halelectricus]